MAKTVLVVDDDVDVRGLVVKALKVKGYQVIEASDGMKASELLGQFTTPPDLLICDVMMPTVDGFTFAKLVRSRKELKGIPIIFLTAKTSPDDVVHGIHRECWERVQELLDARAENKTRKTPKHDFACLGLIHCGHCGCLLVGELKKGKYVYYHCTGNRGKCSERYARQEIVAREFGSLLKEIVISPEHPGVAGRRRAQLRSDKSSAAPANVKRLQGDYQRINTRIETMYMDKLDGRITSEFYDQRSAAWRGEKGYHFGGEVAPYSVGRSA